VLIQATSAPSDRPDTFSYVKHTFEYPAHALADGLVVDLQDTRRFICFASQLPGSGIGLPDVGKVDSGRLGSAGHSTRNES